MPISPFYGNIAPFYGNISPFYGNIAPFYGNITPFWGNISPFWGNISPFTQSTDPSTLALYGTKNDPFWGTGNANPWTLQNKDLPYNKIAGFWQSEAANWQTIQDTWSKASTTADYGAVAASLKIQIIDPAGQFWGKAVDKATKSTTQAYLSKLFAQAGVTLNADGSIDSTSLSRVSETQRAVLFLGIYDNLMTLTGTGHVDWWMGATGWSPALAATQGTTPKGGTAPTIGMLDFVINADSKHLGKRITQYGSTVFSDGHGAAVGSLIMGSVDGSGIMGVMPTGSANVIVYDPYDGTRSTNWDEVGKGIAALDTAIFKHHDVPVGVLNASLGVSGWTLHPGWNTALRSAGAHGHDLVIAAGNDGITQTQNVAWNFAANPTILVVGSVGLDGTISNFSNRPGEACLLANVNAGCVEANKLKYRFLVAPGELILVSDGKGGIVRQSGTSLAAPLVSGAIGLLQNRWPWLANHPDETAQIILKSATKLGTSLGADPIYGAGMLNIAASQSPLDWSQLVYYNATKGKIDPTPVSFSTAIAQVRAGTQQIWNTSNTSYTVIEKVGNTIRDFQIPLSSRLIGTTVATNAGGQYYQGYLTAGLLAQAGRFATLAGTPPVNDILGVDRSSVPTGRVGGLMLRTDVARRALTPGFRLASQAYTTDAVLSGERFAVKLGFGNGAAAIDGRAGFGFRSDYQIEQGGAGPFLGLASGGAYLSGSYLAAPDLVVSFGSTQRRDRRELAAYGLPIEQTTSGLSHYEARAEQFGVGYAVSAGLTLRGAATLLHERAAALGIQSIDPTDLGDGATTTGTTVGFDLALSHGLLVTGSGTIGTTQLSSGMLRTNGVGLVSTAAELAVTKTKLFGAHDSIRVALSKPLHIESGTMRFGSVGVVDRNTGELGVIEQSFDPVGGQTPIAGEIMYGRGFAHGRGALSLFGRAEAGDPMVSGNVSYAGGAQIQFGF